MEANVSTNHKESIYLLKQSFSQTWGAIPEPMIIHYISRKGPLGYFISPEFPSAYYGDKTPECILMFPQLKNYTTWYPVKASFFEDIQSSEFWVRFF
jgi:hypothetical protein